MAKKIIDKDELDELPPEERIKKLDELKKDLEKEEKNIKKMLDETYEEMERRQRDELLKDVADSVEDLTMQVPQPEEEENLEEGLSQTQATAQEVTHEGFDYALTFGLQPTEFLYQRTNELANFIYAGGASEENVDEIAQLQSAVEQRATDIEEGRYTGTEQIVNQLSTSRQIISAIMEKYKT